MPDCKIKTIASEYGVNKSTIRFRLETNKLTAKDFKKPGWNVFSAETEAQLANLIAIMDLVQHFEKLLTLMSLI